MRLPALRWLPPPGTMPSWRPPVLYTVAVCRGAIHGLMAEVIEGQTSDFTWSIQTIIRLSERAKAAQDLIDVIKMYMK
jgi:hypothetical protein